MICDKVILWFSGAFTVAAVVLIGQIHISYSYFLLRGKKWTSRCTLHIPSVICICHLHSSSFAFINQFIITALPCAALSVPSCLRDGLSAVPGAHIDIGVVTLGFMRHVMVCFSTVFTPQCVSVFFSTKPQNAGVNFQDGYWAGECLPVVSNKGWMYDCDVCLFSLFSLTFCVSVCVCLCGGEWEREIEFCCLV